MYLDKNLLIVKKNLLQIIPEGPINNKSAYGWVQNKCGAIAWFNDDRVLQCFMASPGHSELKHHLLISSQGIFLIWWTSVTLDPTNPIDG